MFGTSIKVMDRMAKRLGLALIATFSLCLAFLPAWWQQQLLTWWLAERTFEHFLSG